MLGFHVRRFFLQELCYSYTKNTTDLNKRHDNLYFKLKTMLIFKFSTDHVLFWPPSLVTLGVDLIDQVAQGNLCVIVTPVELKNCRNFCDISFIQLTWITVKFVQLQQIPQFQFEFGFHSKSLFHWVHVQSTWWAHP